MSEERDLWKKCLPPYVSEDPGRHFPGELSFPGRGAMPPPPPPWPSVARWLAAAVFVASSASFSDCLLNNDGELLDGHFEVTK